MNASSSVKKSSFYFNKSVKIIAAVFIGLYLIIWAISSPLSKYFIAPILSEQGLTLSPDTSIRYNPFISQLTVSDLTLYLDKKEKVLSINKLTIRLTLFRLLFDKIVISKFQLDNAYIKINKTATQFVIAGIDLNKESSRNESQEKTTEAEPKPLNYQLLLPKLDFSQINIDIENNNKPHLVIINSLLITQVKASEQDQQANVNLQSIIDGTILTLNAKANFEQGQGEVITQLALIDYPIAKLQRYVEDLSELSGSFSLISEQTISITPDQIKLHINEAEITNKNLIVGYEQQFFTLEKLQQNISDLKLTLNQGEITELSGQGQIILNKGSAHYNKPSQRLVYFEQLALNDMSFHLTYNAEIKVAEFIIDDIFASKNEDTDLPPLMKLKQFSISDIIISEHYLAVNQIVLDSLQSRVIVNKEKVISNLVTLPATEEDEKEDIIEAVEEEDQEIKTKTSDFIISLNGFSLINDNQLSFVDNSVEPAAKRKLFIDKLTLGPLSNAQNKKDNQTPFELIGRSNKYAHFDFKGFTQPFSPQPVHHIEGFLKELSLRAVSTYMQQAMQIELKNGQLNTNIDITLKGEQLDGNVVILLQGLETGIADSDEAGALIDQGALPLNIALGMLKDSDGNVELDVPLSGSTSDPQFGMSSIVSLITEKAIWMATQDYLLKTFFPYANIVSVAMKVGEFALKLRFDDLPYQAKQIEINEEQQAYVQAFIKLMQDKEDTRVNICAISVPTDINLKTGSKVADKNQIKKLKEIAVQREEVFKEYIIKHGKIASSRLLLCSPKIDTSENAQPRIELSV
ncbi:MAG: DUF748 domain-containing protein [Colwellia sp.]|nr:DUF748 domain-containing protein [Colwellia sp.]